MFVKEYRYNNSLIRPPQDGICFRSAMYSEWTRTKLTNAFGDMAVFVIQFKFEKFCFRWPVHCSWAHWKLGLNAYKNPHAFNQCCSMSNSVLWKNFSEIWIKWNCNRAINSKKYDFKYRLLDGGHFVYLLMWYWLQSMPDILGSYPKTCFTILFRMLLWNILNRT